MDALLFHPKLVHVPMALAVLMPLVAGGLLLAWRRDWLPRRAWWVVIGLQVVLLGSGMLALRSGEAEEERVEAVVPERVLEAHEEAAKGFVGASAGVLAIMLLASAFGSRKRAMAAATSATLGTLVVGALGYRTGQQGGSLVYEHGAARAYVGGASGAGLDARAEGSRAEGGRPDDD